MVVKITVESDEFNPLIGWDRFEKLGGRSYISPHHRYLKYSQQNPINVCKTSGFLYFIYCFGRSKTHNLDSLENDHLNIRKRNFQSVEKK